MIIRREISGIHLYDRRKGLHCLFDEIGVAEEDAIECGPRQLSVMLTKKCNANCGYCYSAKGESEIATDLLFSICDAAAELNVLDVTFGGGEPTLHSQFYEIAAEVWKQYEFGLSVTSNGQLVQPLMRMEGMLSQVRISIDSYERNLTPKIINILRRLSNCHSLGVNILFSPNTQSWLSNSLDKLSALGIFDVLIIPEHRFGRFVLSREDWQQLDEIIKKKQCEFSIKITSDAEPFFSCKTLNVAHKKEFLFVHIDDEGNVKDRSWGNSLCSVRNKEQAIEAMKRLHPLRRKL